MFTSSSPSEQIVDDIPGAKDNISRLQKGAGGLFLKNRGENQTLVRAIPFCGEYPGPRFEDKFRSAN